MGDGVIRVIEDAMRYPTRSKLRQNYETWNRNMLRDMCIFEDASAVQVIPELWIWCFVLFASWLARRIRKWVEGLWGGGH